jgi:hypothetical protein
MAFLRGMELGALEMGHLRSTAFGLAGEGMDRRAFWLPSWLRGSTEPVED